MNAIRVSLVMLMAGAVGCDPTAISFSPNGKQIALLTTQEHAISGVPSRRYTTRLAVVTLADKKVRVLDKTDGNMFSSPAFRPDGKAVCYLRIPVLYDEDERARHRELRAKRAVDLSSKSDAIRKEWGMGRSSGKFSKDIVQPLVFGKPITNPPLTNSYRLAMILLGGTPQKATLIVRNVSTGKVISETPLRLPIDNIIESKGAKEVSASIRPQYSPDGKQIYLCDGNLLMVINPATDVVNVLAAPAEMARLSPDGKTMAVYQKGAIGFIHLTRGVTVHKKFDAEYVLELAWKDNQTVLVATPRRSNDKNDDGLKLEIYPVKSNGETLKPMSISLPKEPDPFLAPHFLAISPDGRHMVAALGGIALFMDGSGKVLKTVISKNGFLVAPAFSPDGKTVAMKRLDMPEQEEPSPGIGSLRLFSPEGKELLVIPEPKWPERPGGIPKLKPLKTGPALYKPPKDKTLLVLVYYDYGLPREKKAALMFTERLNKRLLAHKIVKKVVPVAKITAHLKAGQAPDRRAMRKALGADITLWVTLNSFPATKKYTDSQRQIAPSAKITMLGPSATLWPAESVSLSGYKVSVSIPLGKDPLPDKTENALREQAWDRLAEKICRCFYDSRQAGTK